jgi:hypothetical protein
VTEPAGPERPVPDAVRVQILATEHWSLLATRQLAWTEAFTRASIFLTVLSALTAVLGVVAALAVGALLAVYPMRQIRSFYREFSPRFEDRP